MGASEGASAAVTNGALVPVVGERLDNGLRVVMAPNRQAAGTVVAIVYDVGFRSEPRGRTGFAHLFEHLMFEGSVSLPKGMHAAQVNGNGGLMSGRARYDYTAYFEFLPACALELGLFLEADRMRGLRLTEETLRNQVMVVEEEVKLEVLNQPDGGFPWLWLPMVLFRSWPNAHNFYGEFHDLEDATLEHAEEFFYHYYAPGNAVLALSGGFDPDDALRLVEAHFGDIPARAAPLPPNADEPFPEAERREVREDPWAAQPALAVGYRTPHPRQEFEDYCALVLAAAALGEGSASRLAQRLVKRDQLVTHLATQVGLLEGPFGVRHPSMFQVAAWHPSHVTANRILASLDEEYARLAEDIQSEELDRVRNAYLAEHLRSLDQGVNRALALAISETLHGDPQFLNEIPTALAEITPKQVAEVTARWLRPERRAVLEWRPGGAGERPANP